MNTVKQWLRATRALGFALVLMSGSSGAMSMSEPLSTAPAQPTPGATDDHACDPANGPSVIAYRPAPATVAPHCGASGGGQNASPLPGARQHRFADPASDSLPTRPVDNRRYSF